MKIKSLVAASLLTLSAAQAAVIINVAEVGSDVIFTGSGNLQISGLQIDSSGAANSSNGAVMASAAYYSNFVASGSGWTIYRNVFATGPSDFGNGAYIAGASVSGSLFEFEASSASYTDGFIALRQAYNPNTNLNFETTFTGQTFAGLGMTPGTYQWTLINNDTITMNIGVSPTVVPAPLPLGLLALGGLIGLGFSKRRVN